MFEELNIDPEELNKAKKVAEEDMKEDDRRRKTLRYFKTSRKTQSPGETNADLDN